MPEAEMFDAPHRESRHNDGFRLEAPPDPCFIRRRSVVVSCFALSLRLRLYYRTSPSGRPVISYPPVTPRLGNRERSPASPSATSCYRGDRSLLEHRRPPAPPQCQGLNFAFTVLADAERKAKL